MKANELRVGNVIKNVNTICTIEGILNDTDLFVSNEYEEWYPLIEECEPIRITEEWLLKFGFKKAEYEKNYPLYFNRNKTNYADAISISVYVNFCRITIVDKTVNTIKYVHQLQNLYFALTGEELTLKE